MSSSHYSLSVCLCFDKSCLCVDKADHYRMHWNMCIDHNNTEVYNLCDNNSLIAFILKCHQLIPRGIFNMPWEILAGLAWCIFCSFPSRISLFVPVYPTLWVDRQLQNLQLQWIVHVARDTLWCSFHLLLLSIIIWTCLKFCSNLHKFCQQMSNLIFGKS